MRILFALLIVMLSSVAVYAQEGSMDATMTVDASLRSGPGTDWRRITIVPAGATMRVDGRAPAGGWVRGVTQNNEQGWVIETAVSLNADQLAALPSKWVDDPFTVSAPPGGSPSAVPAADNPPADVPADQPPVSVINTVSVRGFEYGGHVDGFGQNAINQMHHAGMTWVKRQLHAFQDYATPINEAHANGFHILLGIVGDANAVGDDGYLDQYAQSLAAAAAAGADAIEVWNEPNIDHEWAAGQISAQRYTEMLRRAYQAIKAANPNTLVISAAPAPTGYFGGCSPTGCDDNQFIQGMARAGAANYMDCVGVHYNEGILPPNQTSGDPRGSSGYYTRYFWGMVNTYNAAFGGARKLCFTEFGYVTPEGYGPLPGAFGWAQNVTVAQQAAWIDQAASLAANSGKVRMMIIWNVDFTNYGADPMAGYAIIRPGGGCPACDALAQ